MSFFAELKRRNVIRVAIAYVAVSWLVLQAGSLMVGALELPNALMKGLIVLLAIGFIPVLVFSWIYELTPEGLKRESEIDSGESITHLTGRKLDFLVIGVLVAVVGLLLLDKFVLAPRHAAQVAATPGQPIESAPATREAPAPATTAAAPASIAVLPFVDMSQAKDQEYFSDGLSEELLNVLAKVPELRVIARTSSFSFKGKEVDVATIAKTLNVANVLEGSVRKSGNTLRITAQLIRAVDSTHLWSETYDREMTDVFKVQDEIAGAVVAAMKLKLLGAAPNAGAAHETKNVEAYNQYLVGKQAYNTMNLAGWRKSEAAYKQAVALDPSYAAAWAGMSITQALLSDFNDTAAEIAQMKRAAGESAERAIAIAPGLGDGYAARGNLRASSLWDWSGAEADLDKALALDPTSTSTQRRRLELWASLGRIPEAIAACRKLIASDPLNDQYWVDLASYLLETEGLEPAREAARHATTINPSSSYVWTQLGNVELVAHNPEAARAAYDRAGDIWVVFGRALVEHQLGNADKAKAALDEAIRLGEHGAAYQIAEIYAFRGEADQAFVWLERAIEQRDAGLPYLSHDSFIKPLRADPRYAAIRRKIGLPG